MYERGRERESSVNVQSSTGREDRGREGGQREGGGTEGGREGGREGVCSHLSYHVYVSSSFYVYGFLW